MSRLESGESAAPPKPPKKCANCGESMADTQVRCLFCDEYIPQPKPKSWHACENEGANCIDFIGALSGKIGRICWCECHPWNNSGAGEGR